MDIEKSFWFDIAIQYLLICSIESRWSVCNELLLITVFIWKSIPLSDSPPTSPPPPPPCLFTSPSLHLTHPPVYLQSRSRPTDEISLTFHADIFRLLFCRSGWHRWASISPTWPSYKAALPAKSGPAHPGTGELEWVWPYCAAPASPSHHIPLLRLPFCRRREHFFPHRAPAP